MNRITLLAAGALAIGGLTYTGCDKEETASDTRTAGQKVENAADKAGEKIGEGVDATVDATKRAGDKIGEAANDARTAAGKIGEGTPAAPDAEGIRDVLAQVTEAALQEGKLDDLAERLVDDDRNRMKGIGDDSAEHTNLVKQFRADWKAKYNQEFDIENEEAAFPATMLSITQGEIGDAAPSGAEVATGKREGDVDTNLEKGRNIATVQIKESHGMPALTVPLLHEAVDKWKIDVPNTITDATKLRSNILAHLKAAHDMKAKWPDNVNDAYGAVTHHVLEALMDKPVQ